MSNSARLSRRQMLLGLTGAAGAAILAACGDAAPAAPTTGAAPAATTAPPAAAATTAPAAMATTAPAAMATTAPAAMATTAPAAMATTGAAATTAPAAMSGTATKLTYWGGLIFSDDANNWQVQAIKDWGKQNKLEIDVVMINQNETNMKVAAAVESKTMPDGLDLGLDLLLLLTNQNQLLDLSDTYTKIGAAHGGWLKSVDTALDKAKFSGQRAAIPYGTGGNVIFRRTDLLMKAGVSTDAPKMWTDIGTAAEKTTKPPIYGMGFALSNVGDGNTQVQVLQSWGGRIADDAGKMVTLKSAATKEYPPVGDGPLQEEDLPPRRNDVGWRGRQQRISSGAGGVHRQHGQRVGLDAGERQGLAQQHAVFCDAERPEDACLPRHARHSWYPEDEQERRRDESPLRVPLLEGVHRQVLPARYLRPRLAGRDDAGYLQERPRASGVGRPWHQRHGPRLPDVNNTAYADFNNNYLVPKMIQRVVIDNYDLDKAIDEHRRPARRSTPSTTSSVASC